MNFVQKMSKIINIDLSRYFLDIVNFYDQANNEIYRYYTVNDEVYPQEAFIQYKEVQERTNLILDKIQFYKGLFYNVGYWDIVDKIDSINQKLDLIKSYPKYAKVNFIKSKDYNSPIFETYVLKQNETLESLVLSQQSKDSWEDVAIYNKLREEDYTSKGGVKIILKSSTDASLNLSNINSIIDIAIGDNLLGKDFPDYFEFSKEENDLFNDSPQQTFISTVRRLLQLSLGSIPEFLHLGVQKDISVESVKGDGFLFPLLLRQLVNVFDTDDTIINFTITDTKKEEDALYMYITVQNRLGVNIELYEKI